MDADEITREPLARFNRSPKALDDQKRCIWAVAMRLMEASDPDAGAHVSMVGQRIGLNDREVSSAITNAARRTGWEAPRSPQVSANTVSNGIQELGDWADPWDTTPSWAEANRPERCDPPENHGHSGWPEDHPECAQCVKDAEWHAAHKRDHYWGFYVAR
jgi:hypothetical protein